MSSTTFSPESITSIHFSSLAELDKHLSTTPQPHIEAFLHPHEPLLPSRQRSITNDQPKTPLRVLVCHDFKGGYQDGEDRCPLGYFPHGSGSHYFLQFPSLIDTFIYFAHYRISIPPVSWINSLHRQGIPCLGTVIFEGNGADDDLERLVMRRDEDGDQGFVYVDKLVELAVRYGFDGWLINVETSFRRSEDAKKIVLFCEVLKSEIKKRIDRGIVIWYDAFMAVKNRVFYQNGVNELNYDHFESSDIFFTNYWWDESTLRNNILNIGLLGVKKKLFVGIDVWGRGSKVGKGGYDTGLAINFLRVYSSNVALFAPAWTYENFDPIDEFLERDRKFWIGEINDAYPGGSVGTYIAHYNAAFTQRKNGGMSFYTNFSRGEGQLFKVKGKTVFNKKWVNGSLQMSLPTNLNDKSLELITSDAFIGGTSLKIEHIPGIDSKDSITQIFQFQKDVESSSLRLGVSFRHITKHDVNEKEDEFFQLVIQYYVERRYRSVTHVRDGTLCVPLKSGGSNHWKRLETTIGLPKMREREYLLISGVAIRWTSEIDEMMRRGDGDSSWVMVRSDEAREGSDDDYSKEGISVLIGDLLIETEDVQQSVESVKEVKKTVCDQGVFVQWDDDDDVLMWLVYENAKFQRPMTTPCYVSQRGDRVRVDCVTRSGRVITGDVIFI